MRVLEKKRSVYNANISKKKTCQFCDKKNMAEQICTSLTSHHWFVIASKYPYMDGNLIIISKRHVEDIDTLSSEERKEWFEILECTKQRLGKVFSTTSFNISINIGEYSARSIAHLHWQIIPRDRISNQNALNIFQDIHVISLDHKDVVRLIDERNVQVHEHN
ncbi:HIT domain-containing protein [Candidatus Uhrbacteria bacterium]|nr:HIT domain-containing protein [Candidatus Uhrbacteria bacterium]